MIHPERYIGKVGYYIRMDLQVPTIAKNMFFVPDVGEQGQRVFFIKPEHPTTTTSI
jgi:hypothetical protein